MQTGPRFGTWKSLGSKKPIGDIKEFVRQAAAEGQTVHIGTDSLQTGKFTQFVTVLIVYTRGKGGRVAYVRDLVPRIDSLRERLLKEVWRSTELGLELTEIVKGDLTISIDANPVVQHRSSQYLQELVGLVVGQGFKVLVKPDAFAASHVADHIVRTKGKLPKVA